MDTKRLQSAIADYSKNNDLKGLTVELKELVLFMGKKAPIGYEVKFLNRLPVLLEALKSLDLEKAEMP